MAKRPKFKDSKVAEFITLLVEATHRGEELTSKDMQVHFGFTEPKKWANFKRYVQLRIETITGGVVTIESRKEFTAYYRLEGDPTVLELELRTMSNEERRELLRRAIEEKRRREAEAKIEEEPE